MVKAHVSLTFNALPFAPGMLLYITDLSPSMLCPLPWVCYYTSHVSLTFNALPFASGMLLYTTDLLPSIICALPQVCCCRPQISHLQLYVLCLMYVAVHHRYLTFNALSFVLDMLLYTTDLLLSILCPLPQVCCCTPHISYLQCFVL